MKTPAPTHPTVIVLEDYLPFQKGLVRLLENKGIYVMHYSDAEAFITDIKQNPHAVDLIISDVDMPPGITGVELCNMVKKGDIPNVRATTPVALWTSCPDAAGELIVKCKARPPDGTFLKVPFNDILTYAESIVLPPHTESRQSA